VDTRKASTVDANPAIRAELKEQPSGVHQEVLHVALKLHERRQIRKEVGPRSSTTDDCQDHTVGRIAAPNRESFTAP